MTYMIYARIVYYGFTFIMDAIENNKYKDYNKNYLKIKK